MILFLAKENKFNIDLPKAEILKVLIFKTFNQNLRNSYHRSQKANLLQKFVKLIRHSSVYLIS